LGTLTLTITGAAGYVGTATVAAARARGHTVRAVIRGPASADWAGDGAIACHRADLGTDDLTAALDGSDAVIHAAASLAGDEAQMRRDTVVATGALMRAAAKAGVRRVVLVGSVAVYGTDGLAPGAEIDEHSPPDRHPHRRDAYCRAKLAQEALARDIAREHGLCLRILRVGAVWGPGRLWNAHLGAAAGPVLIRLGAAGQIPLAHVEAVARALIRAAEAGPDRADIPEVLNIVDDDLPDRLRFLNALQRGGWPRLVLPLSWRVPDAVAAALAPLGARLPGLLRRPALRARMMPLVYSNARARAALGWHGNRNFEAAMATALAAEGTP